ncbi:OmpA family protein [Ulvibacterium marinum]|uniref:OmpA family protein n=1 Tax=Ulvibacterium marinum TaxID=2419782 RepID=UPI0024942127|nr:OmpA family protein [Ulvibacterium marinum]
MKSYALRLLVVTLFVSSTIFSQEEELQLTSKDSIVLSSWMVSLGYNFVDDSGDAFNDFTTIKDQWNAVAFPSRVSIGRYFESGIGIEAIATYNNYKEGNIIDGRVNPEDISYFGLDTRLSYDLNKVIGQTGFFDPYVGAGLGYTDANNVGRGTYNAIIGFRTWFSDRWALDLSSSGKWSFGNEATNHIQHAAGVIYQFNIKKGLSKKGQEKLALIEAMEKEKQRVNDSIAAADRAREEAAMAKRLAEEKARALAEKERIEAEKRRRQLIEDKIKELGHVYFNFDSHALNSDSRKVLEGLADILKENPDLKIKIASGTDSRGPAPYNLGLSQRRVNSTKDYLLSLGIDSTKLSIEAYGEGNLLNECDDNTYCPEAKHRINRRSEFIVIWIEGL